MNDININTPWWRGLWCMQQTLPYALDTGTLSALEILNKLVLVVNNLVNDFGPTSETIQELINQIKEMDKLLEDIANGKYADLYLDQLESYINDNLINYVARLAYYLFPGLMYDEENKVWRYVLRIPSSWKWLKFSYIWDKERHCWYLGLEY